MLVRRDSDEGMTPADSGRAPRFIRTMTTKRIPPEALQALKLLRERAENLDALMKISSTAQHKESAGAEAKQLHELADILEEAIIKQRAGGKP